MKRSTMHEHHTKTHAHEIGGKPVKHDFGRGAEHGKASGGMDLTGDSIKSRESYDPHGHASPAGPAPEK